MLKKIMKYLAPYGVVRLISQSSEPKAQIFDSSIGEGCLIDKTAYIKQSIVGSYVRIASQSSLCNGTIGDFSYISNNSHLSHIDIGKFSAVAGNVRNRLGSHPSRTFVSTHPIFYSPHVQSKVKFADKEYFPDYGGRVTIKNDVWVGYNVILMDGLTIHSGAIIAAGAVVTKDVPPYAIWGGVPARLIRYRFSESTIEKLLSFEWWNKDIAWIHENYKFFHDINNFEKKFL